MAAILLHRPVLPAPAPAGGQGLFGTPPRSHTPSWSPRLCAASGVLLVGLGRRCARPAKRRSGGMLDGIEVKMPQPGIDFFCPCCRLLCTSQRQLDQHLRSKRHLKRMKRQEEGELALPVPKKRDKKAPQSMTMKAWNKLIQAENFDGIFEEARNDANFPHDRVVQVLKLAASKGGATEFAEALQLVSKDDRPTDLQTFHHILGLLLYRVPTPRAMVRLLLNMAVRRTEDLVPLVPPTLGFGAGQGRHTEIEEREELFKLFVGCHPVGFEEAGLDSLDAFQALKKVEVEKLMSKVKIPARGFEEYYPHFLVLLVLDFMEEMAQDQESLARIPESLMARSRLVPAMSTEISENEKSLNCSKVGRCNFISGDTSVGMGVLLCSAGSDPLKGGFLSYGRIEFATLDDGFGRINLVLNVGGKDQVQKLDAKRQLDVYSSVNLIAFERQLTALLTIAKQKNPKKRFPLWDLLPISGVGGDILDSWASRMRDAVNGSTDGNKQNGQVVSKQQKLQVEHVDLQSEAKEISEEPNEAMEVSEEPSETMEVSEEPLELQDILDGWATKMQEKTTKEQNESLKKVDDAELEATDVSEPLDLNRLATASPPLGLAGQRLLQDLMNFLEGQESTSIRDLCEPMSQLNASQREAVQAALARRLTVIQGPPGTGKTHVSVEILRIWAEMGVGPVLVTSHNNVAVDNIAEKALAAGLNVVRMARGDRISQGLDECSIDFILQQQYPHLAFGDRTERFEASLRILDEADAICVTTISSASTLIHRRGKKYGAILMDEAAQTTELSALVPLTNVNADRLVLVGDQCQLPATSLALEAEVRGLTLSLFQRLVIRGLPSYFLDTQFRMHPCIAEHSSREFYEGKLCTGVTAESRPPPAGFDWPIEGQGVAFLDTAKMNAVEARDRQSWSNPTEAFVIAEVLRCILKTGELQPSQVGVVTPYMGQVRTLRRELTRSLGITDFRELLVASVDSFQGREKELILFSAVRSNFSGRVGFLADWRRLNVMITRARRGLVIVGNTRTLKSDPAWAAYIGWAKEAGYLRRV